MTIYVTQDDIDLGQKSSTRCPIARAINRALEKAGHVWVGHSTIYIKMRHSFVEVPLSRECDYFTDMFDKNQIVKPFSFELNI